MEQMPMLSHVIAVGMVIISLVPSNFLFWSWFLLFYCITSPSFDYLNLKGTEIVFLTCDD